jgi:ATP-dependent DNA helicase RecG
MSDAMNRPGTVAETVAGTSAKRSPPSAGPRHETGRSLGELLGILRVPVEAAYRAVLSAPGPEPGHAPLASQAAAQLAHALGRARGADRTSAARRENLATALQRFSEEIAGLATQPPTEQQRLLATGLRLCTWAEMEIGPAHRSPAKPSLSAAPQAARPAAPAGRAGAGKAGSAPRPAPAVVEKDDASIDPSDDRSLERSLLGLPGVGPRTAERLAQRGLQRVIDLLYFLPRRWEDLRAIDPVGALREGVLQTTVALVEKSRIVPARRRFLEAATRGEDGQPLLLRWFHFHGGMARRLLPGQRLLITGTPMRWKGTLQIVHPEIDELGAPPGSPPLDGSAEAADDAEAGSLSGRVRVRYPDIEGVPPRTLERLCQTVSRTFAPLIPDGLPATLRHKLSLPALDQALLSLHLLPPDVTPQQLTLLNEGLAPPQRRLIFEELFFLQLGLIRRRARVRTEASAPCSSDEHSLDRLRAVVPFSPTRAQERAIAAIARDLSQPLPMQRLLHGDVGSGKTFVAYAACELVMTAKRQAVIMAPTEILAEQHARTLGAWARATGRRLALLTATTPKTARKTTLAQLQAGRFEDVWRLAEVTGERLDRESILAMLTAGFLHIVVGTHALIAERVEFHDLGLVVIDEQHRFGVDQRAALRRKGQAGDSMPHLLVMTATPIPRTLALTLYGDLDVTQLDELPPGRTPPVTRVLGGAAGLKRAVAAVRGAVAAGRQAYWVCPLIEESEKLDFQSVTTRHASLLAALPELRVGLVHGRLSSSERDDVMERFRRGELHLLCATTVIEVGVDVPNASLMIVEGAERFGLAQLHQLRGRIGRGEGASACLLLHDTPTEIRDVPEPVLPMAQATTPLIEPPTAKETAGGAGTTAQARLSVLARSSNGFHIAEADLRLRGPGEVLGTRQAGLPPLRYADLLRDIDLLQIARREAAALISRDPELALPEHRLTHKLLLERWALVETTLE